MCAPLLQNLISLFKELKLQKQQPQMRFGTYYLPSLRLGKKNTFKNINKNYNSSDVFLPKYLYNVYISY